MFSNKINLLHIIKMDEVQRLKNFKLFQLLILSKK